MFTDNMRHENFRILTSYLDVQPYLPDVIDAADSDKDALGFFARTVFTDYARKDLLFVLVIDTGDGLAYGGHLLFDARFPKAHVRQLYVLERHRARKYGETLISALKLHLTELQFISIQARVAEDLRNANNFWAHQDFYPQRVVAGGATKKRMIIVRVHELQTPQLFSASGINATNPLGLDVSQNDPKPLFLLDLNVLFDLGPRRPRHRETIGIFRAERMNMCTLAISSEIDAELKRTAEKGKTDPMQALARALPKFATPPDDAWQILAPELAEIIFPARAEGGTLTDNDVSDLRHLATSIYHGLPGLITSDRAVLASAKELRQRYGIEIISPEFFQENVSNEYVHDSHSTKSEFILNIDAAVADDEESVQALLRQLDVSMGNQAGRWAAVDGDPNVCRRFVVRDSTQIVGYLKLAKTLHASTIEACVAVQETSEVAQDAVRLMLNQLANSADESDVVSIRILCPQRQATVREIAANYGYTASARNSDELQKVMVSRIITNENWHDIKSAVAQTGRIQLPDEAPKFRHVDQQVAVLRPDGQRVHVSIFSLETLLAPALFCLDGRQGVMVPLQSRYSDHLLGATPQGSLLPKARAQLFQQRHYLSGPATLKSFRPGDLIFFYESGERGAVVAVARILRSYQRDESTFGAVDFDPSVLESHQLHEIGAAKTKTVTAFDNLMPLSSPVTREHLVMFKCGEPHQLLTSRRLTSVQVQQVLKMGMK